MADVAANGTQEATFQLAAENTFDSKAPVDSFWFQDAIDISRWNQSYPFQLLVVRLKGNGYVADSKWKFTLPIPPEAISISMPFAINLNLTLGGAVEEHNGAPLRLITLSGTTGVLPLKGSAPVAPQLNAAQAIFAGTLAAVTQTLNAFQTLSSGSDTATPNLVPQSDVVNTEIGKSSGYYQFRLLQQWFERYAALKKTKAGRDARLALAFWKQQAVYLVTPVSFDVRQAVPDVFEYKYNLQFKAWKRIQLDGPGPLSDQFKPVARNPNKFATLMKELNDARTVLQDARKAILAIAGDIDQAVFEPIREVSLFCKDAMGVPLALSDLPGNVLQDARSAIVEALSVGDAASNFKSTFLNNIDTRTRQAYKALVELGASSSKANTRAGDPVLPNATSLDALAANDVFNNPQDYFSLFSLIQPGDLNLAPSTIRKIVAERDRVRQLGRLDFENLRDVIVQRMADYADAVGAGNATYSAQYGRQPVATTRAPTDLDFDVLFSLNRVAMQLNQLAASGTVEKFKTNSIDYVAGLASRSGIAFVTPVSKLLVPFPYGYTLERLAAQYLGDRDRWIEIATLNGLRAPYVDEEGFDLPLLVNGAGNQVFVSDASNLYVGQQVWLSATNTARTTRHVTRIERVSAGQYLLQLDGLTDLSRFTTLGQASLHAFLPDTVNSMQSLYIPSTEPSSDQDFQTKGVPGIDQFDPLIRVGGIDLLLTPDGDLAITPDGDQRLAVGLTNIVQTARIRLGLVKKTLPRHPEIGLDVQPGMSTADLSAAQLATSARDLFADDDTFSGVTRVSVQKQGPVAAISMAVGVNGVSQLIPITVLVKR